MTNLLISSFLSYAVVKVRGLCPRPTSRTGYLLLLKLLPGETWVVPLERLVDCSGLEPPTSRLSGECSNQLS